MIGICFVIKMINQKKDLLKRSETIISQFEWKEYNHFHLQAKWREEHI